MKNPALAQAGWSSMGILTSYGEDWRTFPKKKKKGGGLSVFLLPARCP